MVPQPKESRLMKPFLVALSFAVALGCTALPPPLPTQSDPANPRAAESPAPPASITLRDDAPAPPKASASAQPMDMDAGGTMQGMQMDGAPGAGATAKPGGHHHPQARPPNRGAADGGAQ